MRYKLTLSYDGTDFHGWQVQPGFRTVQQELEAAVLPLSPNADPVLIHGSGRTDAGVHANGQVAHMDLAREMTLLQIRRAMNGRLRTGDVRILQAEAVAPDFDARRSARGKEYRYRIWNAEVLAPLQRRYRAHVIKPLNIPAMQEAAARFVGEKDFCAFSAKPSHEIEDTVRTIFSLDVVADTSEVEFRVTGSGFLYKMVRSIAGFLIAVGTGHEEPSAVDEIIASKLRTSRVASAPPQGLTLWRVWYD